MIRAIFFLLVFSLVSCAKKEAGPTKPEHLEAELIAEVTSIKPGQPFWVGLKLEMENGWHVNWLNPGDAGLAPTIKWALPEGFTAGEINWPIPKRIPVGDLMLFGYEGTVLLLVEITPPTSFSDDEITLSAACDWVVCGDVCIPGEAKLSLELPVKNEIPKTNSQLAAEFVTSKERLTVAYSVCGLNAFETDSLIVIEYIPTVYEFPKFDSMFFFPENQGIINNASVQNLIRSGNNYRLEIERDNLVKLLPKILRGVIVFKTSYPTHLEQGMNAEIVL